MTYWSVPTPRPWHPVARRPSPLQFRRLPQDGMASPHRGRPFDNRQSSPTARAGSASPSRVTCASPLLHSREPEAKRSAPPLPQSIDNRRKGAPGGPARPRVGLGGAARRAARSRFSPRSCPCVLWCAAVARGAPQRRPAASTAAAPAPVAPQRSEELDLPRGSKFEQVHPWSARPYANAFLARHHSRRVPPPLVAHFFCRGSQERIKREEKRESLRKEMRLLWDQQVGCARRRAPTDGVRCDACMRGCIYLSTCVCFDRQGRGQTVVRRTYMCACEA